MKTQGKRTFKFGKIEARIALPQKLGTWPAFWMLGANMPQVGWPASGEIDIMEQINTGADIYGTVHWQGTNGGTPSTAATSRRARRTTTSTRSSGTPTPSSGSSTASSSTSSTSPNGTGGTEEFQKDFFLLLNMAIGGNWPGFNVDERRAAGQDVRRLRACVPEGGTRTAADRHVDPVEAENWAVMSGVQTEACSEGGQNVGWIDTNDWIVWNVNVPDHRSSTRSSTASRA
jgi:hypothetical protein